MRWSALSRSPGGRRTRCPSYMWRMEVGLSRPVVRGVLLVRRTSCPSPLEAEFDTASRSRLGGPAVAYGSAVNEEGGFRRRRAGFDRGQPPLCTTDILSVAAGGGIRHRVAIAAWRPGRRLRLGGKRGRRVLTLPSGLRSWQTSTLYDGHLVRRRWRRDSSPRRDSGWEARPSPTARR